MPMKNPPHPGDFIRTEIIEPAGLSVTGPHPPPVARSRGFRRACGTTQPSVYWPGLARHFAFAYRPAYSGATGDPASPPEVTHHSSVPCHPQTPWCGG